jgi:hypothetical protein
MCIDCNMDDDFYDEDPLEDDHAPDCDNVFCDGQCRDDEYYDLYSGIRFADPGGNSSLYAVTKDNPRIHPCPTCGESNRLTAKDVAAGYQCNICADEDEGKY